MNLLLLVLLIVGASVLAIASRQLRNGSATRYSLRPSLLTTAERAFIDTLGAAKPTGTYIAMKVRLADIFDAPRGDRAGFSRIAQKHVDFLLIDEATCRPVCGVELDDKSHQRTDRRERDAVVDRIFASAGLPLLHVKAQRSYNFVTLTAEIRSSIENAAVV